MMSKIQLVVEKRGREFGKEFRKQLEIDFVANMGSKRYYIQCTLTLSSPEKREQELASFIGVRDSFKKIVLVKEVTKPARDDNGILTMSIFDFLLNKDSLDC